MAFQIILVYFRWQPFMQHIFIQTFSILSRVLKGRGRNWLLGHGKHYPGKKPKYQWWHLLLFYLFIVWHNYFNLIFKLSRPFLRGLFSFFFSLFFQKYIIVHSYLHSCSLVMKIRVSIVIHNRSLISPWVKSNECLL